jgi:hypothetical protein
MVQGINFYKITFFITALLISTVSEVQSQRFYSVVFDQLPKDMQLYARDDNNMAEVPISGVVELPGWSYMSVVKYRNKERIGYTRSALDYKGGSVGHFNTTSTIKAEMADYDFEVYVARNKSDSVLIARKTDIAAGDFFVINGQSNAAATMFGSWNSKYCRTLGRYPDASAAFERGDTLWIPSAWSWTYVGAWGLELQRAILENEGIPTCLINSSLPGAKVSAFLERDNNDPASPTLYGSLLHRVQVANPKRIRAFFWAHGEQEVFENLDGYDKEFAQLFNFWQIDYPMVEKFVVIQSNIILEDNNVTRPNGGIVRDFLRRTKYLFPKTDHFATVGVPGYDGVHYDRPGYEELGRRLFHFLRPEVYHYAPVDKNVRSPDIIRAFYSNTDRTEITLTFDEGQALTWPKDTTITGRDGNALLMSLKNFFYLDNDERNLKVASGKVDKNRVILSLKEPVNAGKISYLPSFYVRNLPLMLPFPIGVFTGPYLINKRGLGAFSFYDVAINNGLPAITLSTTKTEVNSVSLTWNKSDDATGYVLEKKSKNAPEFQTVKHFDANQLTYVDKDVSENEAYIYRIKAYNDFSESAFVLSEIDLSPVLSVEHENRNTRLQTYPNPVTDLLQVSFSEKVTGEVQIVNVHGQRYHLSEIKAINNIEVNTSVWPKGIYIIIFTNKSGKSVSKTVLKN